MLNVLKVLLVPVLLAACAPTDSETPPAVAPKDEIRQPADFEEHVRELRTRLPHDRFHIVIEKPFVVIGDESKVMVQRRATSTVRWAVDLLREAYFKKDPHHILDIWLFKDKQSYERYTREIFGDEPSTPFGYYSSSHRALIMNIGTGGGTLVHELVHPFIDSNFAECPAWFNEGLGSLYEQCQERDGKIMGMTNWRLAGLQQAIRAGELPSFKELTATSTHEFYQLDPGTNYAQARYLCYYLQEQGLLRTYYGDFVSNVSRDPTGYDTLARVLGSNDLKEFQQEWEAYVLKLRFRG